MKICIPTETDQGRDSRVFGHFGSAPYFLICDTETGAFETVDNANQHHSHGMCQPMSGLTGKKIDAVLCGGMGARAVQKLNDAGIKAYQASGGTVAEMIDRFMAGDLTEITVAGACTQHGCH